MGQKFEDIVVSTVKTQEDGKELMEKLIAVAQPSSVFSTPIIAGDYTLITASEVSAGVGFGFGMGGGTMVGPPETEAESADPDEAEATAEGGSGFGGGGGGGGFSMGRPVAVISIGPAGVRVEPVRDVTKVAVAFLTVAGSMLLMLSKMRRISRF